MFYFRNAVSVTDSWHVFIFVFIFTYKKFVMLWLDTYGNGLDY